MIQLPLLIIGAGPFGLALAAYAHHHKIEYLTVGQPMHFWEANMPERMLLRSASDWHLDPVGSDTIESFLAIRQQVAADVEPLSLAFYLQYTRWFQQQKKLNIRPELIARLDRLDGGLGFEATMENGDTIRANNVVLALGFEAFRHVPAELARILPAGRYGHTCDVVDFAPFRGLRCLIIGGRQSAFEWTALLHEEGAAAIHVCYRHDTPQFAEADWSWFNQKVEEMATNPGWFRALTEEEKAAVNRRFWEEGRLKLEPWLAPRINQENVRLWPRSQIVSCGQGAGDELIIGLSNEESITVDYVIFATGYKVDMSRISILTAGNLSQMLSVRNGFPQLDEQFQTNVPGLFVTSMPAVQDFGLFFAFTISARISAQIIGQAIRERVMAAGLT